MRQLLVLILLLSAGCASTAPPAPPSLSWAARLRLVEAMPAQTQSEAELAVLRQAAREAPRDAALLGRLARAAEQAGQPAEALAALDQLGTLEGGGEAQELERDLTRGRLALQAGQSARAATAYEAALRRQPGRVEALTGLGVALDLRPDAAAAEPWHRAALAAAPGDWGVRSNAGLSRLLAGRAGEAVTLLAPAEQDRAAPRRARHNLALALVADGQQARATALLRQEMPEEEAARLSGAFARFATWLASQPR